MDNLEHMITTLLEQDHRSALEDSILEQLQEAQIDLGIGYTEEQANAVVERVMSDLLHQALSEAIGSDTWDEEMDRNLDTLRQTLDDMELHYHDFRHHPGVHAFDMGVTCDGHRMQVRIYLEAFPRICRMDVILPFEPEQAFLYPLCELMIRENYPRRFGALQYDSRDGELSYRYSFPITHGLYADDVRTIFLALTASASASYDLIRQYSIGRFRREQRQQIICNAQNLIIELDR